MFDKNNLFFVVAIIANRKRKKEKINLIPKKKDCKIYLFIQTANFWCWWKIFYFEEKEGRTDEKGEKEKREKREKLFVIFQRCEGYLLLADTSANK